MATQAVALPAAMRDKGEQNNNSLSPSEFLKMFKFIMLSPNDGGDPTPWPCIKFDNMKQCHEISKQRGLAQGREILKMIMDIIQQSRTSGVAPRAGVVFLLGNKTPIDKRIVILDETTELFDFQDKVFDFYTDFGSNQAFQQAVECTYTFVEEAEEAYHKEEEESETHTDGEVQTVNTTSTQSTCTVAVPAPPAAHMVSPISTKSIAVRKDTTKRKGEGPSHLQAASSNDAHMLDAENSAKERDTMNRPSQMSTTTKSSQDLSVTDQQRAELGPTEQNANTQPMETDNETNLTTAETVRKDNTQRQGEEAPDSQGASSNDANMLDSENPAKEREESEMNRPSQTRTTTKSPQDLSVEEQAAQPVDKETDMTSTAQADRAGTQPMELDNETNLTTTAQADRVSGSSQDCSVTQQGEHCRPTEQQPMEVDNETNSITGADRVSGSSQDRSVTDQGEKCRPTEQNASTQPMEVDNETNSTTTLKAGRVSGNKRQTSAANLKESASESSYSATSKRSKASHTGPNSSQGHSTPKRASLRSNSAQGSAKKVPKRDDQEELVTFHQVKRYLEKAGFVFRQDLYCHPGMDPDKNQNATLGKDFFTTEKAFRADLCAYGLAACSKWSDKARESVEQWVRYYVYDPLLSEDQKYIPVYRKLPQTRVWKLLKEIGFTYRNGCLGEIWNMPGVEKGDDGQTSFTQEHELWRHIVRFGFPDTCDFESITEAERFQLIECLISSNQIELDTFERIEPASETVTNVNSGRKTRGKRNITPICSGKGKAARSSTKSSGRKKGSAPEPSRLEERFETPPEKAPEGQTTVAAEAQGRDDAAHSDVSSFVTANQSYCSPPRARITEEVSIASKPVECNDESPAPASDGPAGLAKSVTQAPELPEFTGTDKERLTACLDALSLSHVLETPLFDTDGSSNFSKKLIDVESFLSACILSEGEHGTKPSDPAALYVCGVPGIGKTSGVKWCISKLPDTVIVDEDEIEVKSVHINSSHLSSSGKPINSVLRNFGKCLGTTTYGKTNILRILKQSHKKTLMIAVFDEIDLLVSPKATDVNQDALKGTERMLQELMNWAQNPELRFVLIGISNSCGDNKYARLQQLGKFQENIMFKTYDNHDIVKILEARVGHSTIDPRALELIAKKVATRSGDARKALEMASIAVQERMEKTSDNSSTSGPLVSAVHVVQANKLHGIEGRDYAKVVDGLSAVGKIILCVVATFAKANRKTTTLGDLQSVVQNCLSETNRMEQLVSGEDFLLLMECLVDQNLLATGGASGELSKTSSQEVLSVPIQLRMPLEEVDTALESELAQGSRFYSRLIEKAKRHKE